MNLPDYAGATHTGDRLLLCSDGLTGELTDDAIKEVFDAGFNDQVTPLASWCSQRLISAAQIILPLK